MKRKTAVLLAAVMTVSYMTGCKGTAENAVTAADTAEVSGEVTYPMETKEPVILTYWMPISQSATKFISSYAENEAFQEAQKRTGVKIEFIHPVAGQEKEQFNLLMASGELPDIIQGASYYQGGELKGVDDGAFLDLTPYLEANAPDYYEIITGDEEIKREVFSDDGRVPAFYRINESPIPPATRMVVRQDWLDEFGMEVPVTMNEFEAYFEKIKETKPGVVPFMLPSQNPNPNPANMEVIWGAFNILPDWFLDDGEVSHGYSNPRLKEYLTWMNKWYQAGYISKDFPSIETKQVWAEFDSGNIGAYIESVDIARTRAEGLHMAITSTPYPRVEKEDKLHTLVASWPKAGDVTVVSAESKHKEAAVRFLNYAYTHEGAMLYNYGIEGKSYEMVDGKPKYTDYILNNDRFDAESANYILRIHFAPKLQIGTPLEFNPAIAKSPEAVENRMKWCDDPNTDNAYRLPPISLSPEESTRRAEIMADVSTYSNEMILKFIVGTEPLDAFDGYLEQLKSFGMDEATELTKTAYERYMNRS